MIIWLSVKYTFVSNVSVLVSRLFVDTFNYRNSDVLEF